MSSGPQPREAKISAAGLDLLQLEFLGYLLRGHDDGRVAREALFGKLEGVGYAVGRRFAERLARDRAERLGDVLDVVKFVCREFWSEVFRKPVDKLQTNNKGTFVLQDFNFRPLRYLSVGPSALAGGVAVEAEEAQAGAGADEADGSGIGAGAGTGAGTGTGAGGGAGGGTGVGAGTGAASGQPGAVVAAAVAESGSAAATGHGAALSSAAAAAAAAAAGAAAAASDTKVQALRNLVGACGLVRGALAAFGLDASVNAEDSGSPRVVFHVRVRAAEIAL